MNGQPPLNTDTRPTGSCSTTRATAGPAGALPLRERPAYRVQMDSAACSLVELAAALIGGPGQLETAQRLVGQFGSARALARASAADLASIAGIGDVAAARLCSAFELGRRAQVPDGDRPVIKSPAEAAALFQARLEHREQEYLYVLLLNTRNGVIGDPIEVYHGSLNTSLIRVGEIFRHAVKANAAAIIVAHGHPSGDPTPSPEDVAVTRAIVEAGKLLDVECLDHLIWGHGRFVSLKERGLGF